tara:strand:- start:754 stop:1413 length:660 start_codon:yes stop_codon:yes gene_type:complete
MIDLYVVVGSRGIVGSQISRRLVELSKKVICILTSEILSSNIRETIANKLGLHSIKCKNGVKMNIGVILVHRYRDKENHIACKNELTITRDFVWELSKLCQSLRVVVIGSVTGSYVDSKMPEAYHYSKDIQKSIVRQSIRIGNLHMNLLELSWFKKYSSNNSSLEYKETLNRISQELCGDNLPSVDSITDFSCALIEMPYPPRGQSIVYDGGYTLFQRD